METSKYLLKQDIWQSKQKFLKYKKSMDQFSLNIKDNDSLKLLAHLYEPNRYYGQNNDESISSLLNVFPYLIFTEKEFLYNIEYIRTVCHSDREILSVMLEMNDNKLNKIILVVPFIYEMIFDHQAIIHHSNFKDPSFFTELMRNDWFRIKYLEYHQEELFSNQEGLNFIKQYYTRMRREDKKKLLDKLHVQIYRDKLMDIFGWKYGFYEEATVIAKRCDEDKQYFVWLLDMVIPDQSRIDYCELDDIAQKALIDQVRFYYQSTNQTHQLERIATAVEFYDMEGLSNRSLLFYQDCAKVGIPMLCFSKKRKYHQCYWTEALRVNPKLIKHVPIKLRKSKSFIIGIRHFCEDALCYCDQNLLNDETFMLNYLTIFDSRVYFRLGKMLSNNVSFLKKAACFDPYILFYADSDVVNRVTSLKKEDSNQNQSRVP